MNAKNLLRYSRLSSEILIEVEIEIDVDTEVEILLVVVVELVDTQGLEPCGLKKL